MFRIVERERDEGASVEHKLSNHIEGQELYMCCQCLCGSSSGTVGNNKCNLERLRSSMAKEGRSNEGDRILTNGETESLIGAQATSLIIESHTLTTSPKLH